MTPKQQHFYLRRLSLIIIGGFLVVTIIQPHRGNAAYQEPTLNAPTYDTMVIPEIINIGGSATVSQQKLGSLLVGIDTDKKKLCLNPQLTTYPGVSDPVNCISAWSDLSGQTSGYLRKFDGTSVTTNGLPPYGNPGNTSTATRDTGYVAWQAQPSRWDTRSQLFTFIAETPSGTEDTGVGKKPASAIRAEGDSSANFAGEFLGTLGLVGYGSGSPKLCLNDQGGAGGSCISRWSDIAALSNLQIVNLQNLHGSQIILDQGQTATAGSLVAGSLVAGAPLYTTSIVYSCGDNICQAQTETKTNCSLDCQ